MLNIIIAVGALIGAVDCVSGNRLKLGDKFEEGFLCMGPTALSMVGIICLAPLLGQVCSVAVAPLFRIFGIDPAMFGCILANNMGGYPLAMSMADGEAIGLYSGLIVSSTLGATLVYTIPVALGLIPPQKQDDFARGVMIGLVTVPIGSVAGGFAMIAGGIGKGLSVPALLLNTVPVALVSGLVIVGFLVLKERIIKGFMVFARLLRIVTILSLGAAAFTHICGITLLSGLDSISDALAVVADMCVVQLGSIPLAYLFLSILKKPLSAVGRKLHINDVAVAAIPISCVNVMSVFMMIKNMDKRGTVLSAAWYTNAICIITAHYAYTQSVAPQMVMPVMTAKLVGGGLAVVLAYVLTRKDADAAETM